MQNSAINATEELINKFEISAKALVRAYACLKMTESFLKKLHPESTITKEVSSDIEKIRPVIETLTK